MKKRMEIKVYHESVTIDKAWLEVYAEDLKDAINEVKQGNYEWLDSKQIDTSDNKFIDEDEWIITNTHEPDIGDNTEEYY